MTTRMTPRQRLRIALEIAVRRIERQAPLPTIVGPLQDAITDVSCDLITHENEEIHTA